VLPCIVALSAPAVAVTLVADGPAVACAKLPEVEELGVDVAVPDAEAPAPAAGLFAEPQPTAVTAAASVASISA
jgi:hypothetical protein